MARFEMSPVERRLSNKLSKFERAYNNTYNPFAGANVFTYEVEAYYNTDEYFIEVAKCVVLGADRVGVTVYNKKAVGLDSKLSELCTNLEEAFKHVASILGVDIQ